MQAKPNLEDPPEDIAYFKKRFSHYDIDEKNHHQYFDPTKKQLSEVRTNLRKLYQNNPDKKYLTLWVCRGHGMNA